MPDIHDSVPTDLPTSRQLIRSTVIALVVAAVLLIAAVLPAEYGVDPTGIGGVLGLTEMGRIKQSLAAEARQADAAEAAAPQLATPAPTSPATAPGTGSPAASLTATADAPAGRRNDVMTLELTRGQGREIKLEMNEGARVRYVWAVEGGVVNYDTHADSKVPRRDYYGYAKGKSVARDEGELIAAFNGSHGWYWRNRGSDPVKVTLRTEGEYSAIKEVK